MATTKFKIKDMDCASCAMIIESDLQDAGFKAKCSYANETLGIEHDGALDEKRIREIVQKSGYSLTS